MINVSVKRKEKGKEQNIKAVRLPLDLRRMIKTKNIQGWRLSSGRATAVHVTAQDRTVGELKLAKEKQHTSVVNTRLPLIEIS